MSWAKALIDRLRAGETVTFRPRGHSMTPLVSDGERVSVAPGPEPERGGIVLCSVRGTHYLHLVKATRTNGSALEYQIGNNRGGVNGWIRREAIHGVLVGKGAR